MECGGRVRNERRHRFGFFGITGSPAHDPLIQSGVALRFPPQSIGTLQRKNASCKPPSTVTTWPVVLLRRCETSRK